MTFIQILLHFRQKTKLTFLAVGKKKGRPLCYFNERKREREIEKNKREKMERESERERETF